MNHWLTVKQAADLLHYHPNHVRRLLRRGHIRGRKRRNRHWAIERHEIQRVQMLQSERGRYTPWWV
jgi:excisionase family DNA binding protein